MRGRVACTHGLGESARHIPGPRNRRGRCRTWSRPIRKYAYAILVHGAVLSAACAFSISARVGIEVTRTREFCLKSG